MSFLELVKKRESCRKYDSRPVPREAIERCIEAARLAPSACNSQPWRFIVVENPELKNQMDNQIFSGIYTMNSFARQAPVLVVAINKQTDYKTKLAGLFQGINFSFLDLGIACEHFILEAAEQGLGTCWLGWFDKIKVKKILGLSNSEVIASVISLGYPQDLSVREKKRKSFEEICEFRS